MGDSLATSAHPFLAVCRPKRVWRTPPAAPDNDREPEGHRLPSSSRLYGRGWHAYVEVSNRCCNISYRSTAAVALTLSDSMRPRSGSETRSSHVAATRGRRPLPSAPSTSTTPPL